jgi:hypothetical protein
MGGACSSDGGGERLVKVLVGKPKGKRQLGRSRCRGEDNIRMYLQKVGCGVWIVLGWLRIQTGGEQLLMR